jgi:hypothetical protein
MSIDKVDFHNQFSFSFLPTEPLIGLRLINCHVLCSNDSYSPVRGLELGLLFFKFSFIKVFWKD